MLYCFNTPFGRCRFVCMPFGIVSASDIIQKWIYKTFGDIPNVHVVANYMFIIARDESEHDRILRIVLDRTRKKGLNFNMPKTQLIGPKYSTWETAFQVPG